MYDEHEPTPLVAREEIQAQFPTPTSSGQENLVEMSSGSEEYGRWDERMDVGE